MPADAEGANESGTIVGRDVSLSPSSESRDAPGSIPWLLDEPSAVESPASESSASPLSDGSSPGGSIERRNHDFDFRRITGQSPVGRSPFKRHDTDVLGIGRVDEGAVGV